MSRLFAQPFAGFHRFVFRGALLLSTLCFHQSALAAPPTIGNLSPRGLQIGGTTTITVDGTGLGPQSKLVLPLAISKQMVKPGGTDKRVEIEVIIDARAPAGIYPLRVATAEGISSSVPVGADALPQRVANASMSNSATPAAPLALPIAVHGQVAGGEVFRVQFSGTKGARVLADVESRRLGAMLNPALRVLNPRGTQVASSGPLASIAGDARCEVELAETGTYTVEISDQLYRAASPSFFRLKLGDLHYADVPFPLGITRGAKQPVGFAVSSLPVTQQIENIGAATGAAQAAAWPAGASMTGGQASLAASDFPEQVEPSSHPAAPPADPKQPAKPQPLKLGPAPIAVSGRLSQPAEQDRYTVEVKPGTKYRVELMAERIGSPVDGVLDVEGLGSSDDRSGTKDPGLEITTGASQTSINIAVRDLLEQGGRESVYRLVIVPAALPDFRLSMESDAINIPAGGTAIVKIKVARMGYDGPIVLSIPDLPASVKVSGEEILAGSNAGLLVLSAPADAWEASLVRIVGRGGDGPAQIVREVTVPETALTKLQPYLAGEIGLGMALAAPIRIAWDALSGDAKLPQGGKLPAKAKLTRLAGATGPIRISLVTDQVVPQKEIADPKNPAKKIKVDDIDRTVRLAGTVEIAGDASDALLGVLVPADSKLAHCGIGLKAELLSADKKQVLATAYSDLRKLPVVQLLSLELTSPASVQMQADGKSPPKFVGKIVRDAALPAGPVTITLAGLPDGVMAPVVTISSGKTDFEFPVVLPGTKSGDLKDLQLIAHTGDQPSPGEGSIRSAGVKVGVKIVK